MAMLPKKQFVRALAVGLALAGAAFVGPGPAAHFSASAHRGVPAVVEEPPPPPDPVPVIDRPANPAPNDESPMPRHRRHHGDPVMGR
ncbi:hypothetical protein [Mycobacterium sp.]|uniref:hypothetical protein n=1 Tax=Mycobacterium sp. TaxID=1785 RepID=UPI003D0B7F5E